MVSNNETDAGHVVGMEIGECRWCTKTGMISYTSLKPNFPNNDMNEYVENVNARIMASKLVKIAEGIFACEECVRAYRLAPLSE